MDKKKRVMPASARSNRESTGRGGKYRTVRDLRGRLEKLSSEPVPATTLELVRQRWPKGKVLITYTELATVFDMDEQAVRRLSGLEGVRKGSKGGGYLFTLDSVSDFLDGK